MPRNFFDSFTAIINEPRIDGKLQRAPVYAPPQLTRVEALPIEAKDISLISTNARFVRDNLKVHDLQHYKRDLLSTALTQLITADIDCITFDSEDVGVPINL